MNSLVYSTYFAPFGGNTEKRLCLRVLLLIFLFFQQHAVFSQILDDSTKQVYSTKTVKYVLEEDILNNQKTSYNPDTTLEGFHLFDFNLRSGWLYQDLGNFGTAAKPIFYTAPSQIGRQLGFSVYNNHAFDGRKVQYFNTKSPFTNMNYVQTGRGSNRLHFTHSQNISPQINATMDVRRLTASKQYGPPQTNEDRMLDSWAFMLHSNYESKNKKYIMLANYNHFNHKPTELGGIKPLDESQDLVGINEFGNETSFKQFSSKLSSTTAREKWNDLHLYHQYLMTNGFQVYHVFDYQKRINFYEDKAFRSDTTNLDFYFLKGKPAQNDTLWQDLRYNLIENKFGVKGIYKGFAYRLHLRTRFYKLEDRVDNKGSLKLKNETIVGAWANYYFPDSVRRVYAETEIGSGLDYNIKVEYLSPRFKAGFYQIAYQPTIFDDRFVSRVFNFENNFRTVFSNNFYGNFIFKKGNFTIIPHANYSLVSRYIYYNQEAKVKQDTSALGFGLLRVGGSIEYRWKRWFLSNELYVSTKPKGDIFRVPLIVNNTKIGFTFIYAKVLKINTGVEVYYRSKYKGDNYMPLTRQFFLQDQQDVWGLPMADVFADLQINKVRLFFKYANASSGLLSDGFYVSSTHPALRRTLIMGVNWPLFD